MADRTGERYRLLVVLVCAIAVAAGSWWYTGHSQRENNRKWCSILSSLDQPDVPATTERGLAVQQQIHQLRLDLGCGGGS